MQIDILTLFPDTIRAGLGESILGRAQKNDIIRIEPHQIRDYTLNKQKQVDDAPYGGGQGMIMQAQPLYDCWRDVCRQAGERVHTIYMSPAGKPFTQAEANRLQRDYSRLILVCGHYEGVDERFIEACVDEELSLGDFVLTGGELAAMAIADAVCRLVPGVLSDVSCFQDESHYSGLLEYPQYSRPLVWEGRGVPEVLISGNHGKIARWRRKEALRRTRDRRPDMLERFPLTKEDRELLEELEDELHPSEA
ncbi:MAG: tRNA (guanosine(37)-N1)-methyltransferase TrmD [Oscillospiraceae bacterium]|nr:tRNA (guanosine(37)-N1)-methyltransferase TrmD [Oscillospiraceae bacterium]